MKEMSRSGYVVHQSTGDADSLIVSTALNISHDKKVVVGTDVDLLILLVQLGQLHTKLFFFKMGSGKEDSKVYQIATITSNLGQLCSYMLLLHAFSGCDTTSAAYRQGKKKTFRLQRNNVYLQQCAALFNAPDSNKIL